MTSIEVLPADQEKINKFGNLNTQCISLRMEITELEKKKGGFEAAGEDLELAQMEESMETVPYQIGNTFMELPLEVAIQEIHKDAEEMGRHLAEIKGKLAEKESEMGVLRSVLYAKFGRENINLGE